MKVSNLLPPADQRAKLFSPFDVAGKVAEKIQQTEQSAPIEAKVTQFVKKSETVRLPRFENENEVEQFRGQVEGRGVRKTVDQTLSKLPKRVQPFDSETDTAQFITSFNPAESAALGFDGNAAVAVQDSPSLPDLETPKLNTEQSSELSAEPTQTLDHQTNNTTETKSVGDESSQDDKGQAKPGEETKPNGDELTDKEKQEVQELKARDREVRQHEQAHVAAAGQHARGGISYEYQQGPDGNRYAVGGSVNIDMSEEPTPEATVQKMQQVQRAALAPAEPSGADRAVASAAQRKEQQARSEILENQKQELSEARQTTVKSKDSKSSQTVENLTDQSNTSSNDSQLSNLSEIDQPEAPKPSSSSSPSTTQKLKMTPLDEALKSFGAEY